MTASQSYRGLDMDKDENLQHIDDLIKELETILDEIEWNRGNADSLRRRVKALKELRDRDDNKMVPRF